jgi:membrane protease subunit (stomatin/prohibitin family)
MRALGKSSGAAFGAGLVAIPYVFGQQPQAPQPQAPVAQPQQPVPQAQKEDPADKLRKLKQMLDEGLISKEDYEQTKKKVLAEMS